MVVMPAGRDLQLLPARFRYDDVVSDFVRDILLNTSQARVAHV
jgi:hypothetical protein